MAKRGSVSRPRRARAEGRGTAAPSPRAVFLLGSGAILLVALLIDLATWRSPAAFVRAMDHGDRVFADFVRHFHSMGRAILATHLPVQGWYYTPFFAILLAPLGALSLETGLVVWGALQVAAIVLLCGLPAWRLLSEERSAALPLAYVALVATAHPVLANFVWGQTSVFLTLAALAAVLAYARQRRVPAALLLVVAASIKYYPALLGTQFAVRRDWRAVVWLAAAALALLVAVPVVVLGPGDAWRFQQLTNAALQASRWFAADSNSQFFPHAMARLVGGSAASWLPLAYAVLAAGIGALWLLARGRGPRDPYLGPIVVLLAIPFAVRTAWPHYFVYLPFCQVFLWRAVTAERAAGPGRTALRGVIAVSAALGNILFFNLLGSWQAYGRLGLLLWADALLLGVAFTLVMTGRGAGARA